MSFLTPLYFLIHTLSAPYSHTHATFTPKTRKITRTNEIAKRHAINACIPSHFLALREVICFILLPIRIGIYISLSLGTVPFENVYVDEVSLKKTKGQIKRKLFCYIKWNAKASKNDRRVARGSLSLGRGRGKTEIRFSLDAGRFSRDLCSVSILRKPSAFRSTVTGINIINEQSVLTIVST